MKRVLLRRIVCAVDLSERSVSTLKRALQFARLHGGELLVVHVSNVWLGSPGSAEQNVTDAFLSLRRFTDREPRRTVPVRWIMAHGNPTIELARLIRQAGADLAVVGGALPRPSTGVVGTVAQAILKTTACPVLVIPQTPEDDASPEPYREILCGVSSGLSSATLGYALSFAQEFESRLTILNVENPDRIGRPDDMWVKTDIDRLRTAIPDSARDWCEIDELAATGDPAQEVVKAAQQLESDLVVVGSLGARGFEGGLGSVALAALALTNAGVLIVPIPGLAREIDTTRAA